MARGKIEVLDAGRVRYLGDLGSLECIGLIVGPAPEGYHVEVEGDYDIFCGYGAQHTYSLNETRTVVGGTLFRLAQKVCDDADDDAADELIREVVEEALAGWEDPCEYEDEETD